MRGDRPGCARAGRGKSLPQSPRPAQLGAGTTGGPRGAAGSTSPAPGCHLAYSSAGACTPASRPSMSAAGGLRLFRRQAAMPFGFAAAARLDKRLAAGPGGGNQGPACTLIGKR